MIIDLSALLSSETIELIVLNRQGLSGLYKQLYKQAENIIWTDGAANRIFQEIGFDSQNYLPNVIIGDMDSITSESSEYFSTVSLISDDDQDTTDLEKALKLSTEKNVLILTDNGGRLDHILGCFSAVARYLAQDRKFFIYGINNISFFVKDGDSIKADNWKYCGFFPMFGKTIITTQGLKWNLTDTEIEFGGTVSISNEIIGEIKVSCNLPILFTLTQRLEC